MCTANSRNDRWQARPVKKGMKSTTEILVSHGSGDVDSGLLDSAALFVVTKVLQKRTSIVVTLNFCAKNLIRKCKFKAFVMVIFCAELKVTTKYQANCKSLS